MRALRACAAYVSPAIHVIVPVKVLGGNRLTRVAQDANHCMAWGAIEGNRAHPFDWGSTG